MDANLLEKKLLKNCKANGHVCHLCKKQFCRDFFQHYKQDVTKMVYHILGDDKNLEEIVQKSFIAIFSSLKRFKENASLRTWIYRIVSNICADEIRSNIRRRKFDDNNFINDYKRTFKSDDPAEKLEKKDLSELVRGMVNSMDIKKREAFTLFTFGEQSIREISETLDVPEGTIKFRIFEARKEIHAKLRNLNKLNNPNDLSLPPTN